MASSKRTQNWRLAAKAIIAVAVSLLHAFGREGMPPFSRNETHSQMGSAEPHSQSKASWTAYLAGKIISPLKCTLSTFLSTQPRANEELNFIRSAGRPWDRRGSRGGQGYSWRAVR